LLRGKRTIAKYSIPSCSAHETKPNKEGNEPEAIAAVARSCQPFVKEKLQDLLASQRSASVAYWLLPCPTPFKPFILSRNLSGAGLDFLTGGSRIVGLERGSKLLIGGKTGVSDI
jgi:hypothetical protein